MAKWREKYHWGGDSLDWSESNWENSYFGGYRNVLWDHPDIKIDYRFEFDNPNKGSLGFYEFSKLIKLFLLQAKKQGIHHELLTDVKEEKITKWFTTYRRITLNPKSIEYVVQKLATSRIELSNMFAHYRDLIVDTKFQYDTPDTDDDEDKPEPKGGQQPQSGQGEKQKPKEKEKEEQEGEDPEDGEEEDDDPFKDKEEEEEGDGEGEGEETENKGKTPGAPKPVKSEGSWTAIKALVEALDNVREDKIEYHYVDAITNGGGKTIIDILKPDHPETFTSNEILQAGRLVDLLDISFDPEEDKVQSLKSGKLETSKLGEVHSGNFNVYYRKESNMTTKPFSVCVLIDESGSMGSRRDMLLGPHASNLDYAVSMMKVLYKAFSQILPPSKMFFYGHSGKHAPVISVYHDPYNQNFEKTIGHAGKHQSNNYDPIAMEEVYKKVREYTEDNIIFLVVSDGQPCAFDSADPTTDMKRVIEKCKRDGFVTMGVGVRYDMVKYIYPYYTVIHETEEFVKKVSVLVNHVVKTEFQ